MRRTGGLRSGRSSRGRIANHTAHFEALRQARRVHVEARCARLGAQKQVAGGGRYPEGIGWAIGLE